MKKLLLLLFLVGFSYNLFGQQTTLDEFLDSLTDHTDFNGTILINQDAKTIFHKSFGLANFEFEVPNTTETKFKIASITKLFTSVLIMQLVEDGKIELNGKIKTYLPDYAGEGGQKVTVHQLLNHTSGLANIDTVTSMESALTGGIPLYQSPRTSDQLLSDFCSGNLVNEPGKVFDYNNADYIVLGKIIEKIYAKTYEQAIVENIFMPLQMENTGLVHQDNIIQNLASTYFFRDDLNRLMPDLPVYIENWYAAGAMYATANDLLQFSNALLGLKLVNQESLDKMFEPGLGEYGYGLWVYEDYEINKNMYTIVKRPGSIMGAQAMLFHILDADTTLILLSNTSIVSLDRLARDLAIQVIN